MRLIAPWWHFLLVLLILALAIVASTSGQGTATTGPDLSVYLSVLGFEWVMCFVTWLGTRQRATLRELIGERWSGRTALVALGFWLVFEGTDHAMHWLLHSGEPANLKNILPRTVLQGVVWILLSISAGFCEEFVYRGYLQRQFTALTRSAAAGIVLQAVVFGVSHGYQGWRQVITITVLGVLYGLLFRWQRTLLPGMLSHAWSDIISGFGTGS